MSNAISIDGKKLLVGELSLADLSSFKLFMQARIRRTAVESLRGVSDRELVDAVLDRAEEQCKAITGQEIDVLVGVGSPDLDGLALYYHAHLKGNDVTLGWVEAFLLRAYENDPDAVRELRELRTAVSSVLQKKRSRSNGTISSLATST